MEAVIATARRVLEAGPSLRLAVLFGSQATGKARAGSDVDIAILPVDAEMPLHVELQLAAALSSALGREVDLVRLDHASTLQRWEIARHGVPLVTANPAWTRFRAAAASEHAEIADVLTAAARLFQRRIVTRHSTEHRVIVQKLAMLREHAARVRRRRPAERATFETDVDVQDALALSFLVAVQEANDIAMHVAADEGWGVPGSYAEAFEILAKHGVLSPEHARELGGIAAVRNRIAHGYASVDPGRLWAELPAGLDALERYVDAIARLVGDPPA